MRRALLLLSALALAACDVNGDGSGRGFLTGFDTPGSAGGREALSQPDGGAKPIRRAALAGGAVVVAGPRGYCIDPVTVESDGVTGFAVLASCRILAGPAAGPEVEPALVTVTVGAEAPAPVLPDPATLARLAGSPARAGESRGGLVLAQIQEGGDRVLEGGDPRHWRGAFLLGTRLVSLAVYAPAGSALAADRGRDMLTAVRRAIVRASPEPDRGSALPGRSSRR